MCLLSAASPHSSETPGLVKADKVKTIVKNNAWANEPLLWNTLDAIGSAGGIVSVERSPAATVSADADTPLAPAGNEGHPALGGDGDLPDAGPSQVETLRVPRRRRRASCPDFQEQCSPIEGIQEDVPSRGRKRKAENAPAKTSNPVIMTEWQDCSSAIGHVMRRGQKSLPSVCFRPLNEWPASETKKQIEAWRSKRDLSQGNAGL